MMKKDAGWKNPIFWACLSAFSFCLQLALFLERIASKPNVVMHMGGNVVNAAPQALPQTDTASTGWMDTVGAMLVSSPGQKLQLALVFTVFMYFLLKAIRHVTRASEA